MDDRDALRSRIYGDMKALGEPQAVRESFAIAQHYAGMGYDLEADDIQRLMREVASELGFSGVA